MRWASEEVGLTQYCMKTAYNVGPVPCRTATPRLAAMGIADMERAPRPQLYRAMGGTVRAPIDTEVAVDTQVR